MPQALRNFSNDEVRHIFSWASSVDEARIASTLDELERYVSQWTFSSTGLKSAIKEFAATAERNVAGGLANDVDRLIEDFQRHEVEENETRARIERTSLAKITNADLLKAANEALATYLDLSRSVAQAYHDARWRLMEARAKFMPSAPTGRVHGDVTDLDALIKS
jgi:hypothetical protein